MASSRSLPSCLNPIPSSTVEDPFLTESDFTAVWTYFEPEAVKAVRAALSRVSLHRAEKAAAGREGAHRHLLAGVGAVRTALRGDTQFISDLVQEVRIAMWKAIRRNTSDPAKGIRASLHVVRAWLQRTTRYVTKSHTVRPATLLFASGPADADDEQTDGCGAEHICNLSPELLVDRGRLLDALAAELPPKHIHVVRGLFAGYSYTELAGQLGVTESYARGLFHRTKKRMLELLGARDGPRNGGDPEGDGIKSFEPQHALSDTRNRWILLTSSLFSATVRARMVRRGSISQNAVLNQVLDNSNVEGFRGRTGRQFLHHPDAGVNHERLQRSYRLGRILAHPRCRFVDPDAQRGDTNQLPFRRTTGKVPCRLARCSRSNPCQSNANRNKRFSRQSAFRSWNLALTGACQLGFKPATISVAGFLCY